MKFLITLLLFLHIFACAWVNLGWEPDGWVSVRIDSLPNTEEATVYLAGLYWAITTFATIGYGDITGIHEVDYLFTMAVFLFGICMFSYLLGNINGLVVQLSYYAHITGQQEEELENWLLRMDRSVKKQMSRKQANFITKYLKEYSVKLFRTNTRIIRCRFIT